jgi:hypothetical protein
LDNYPTAQTSNDLPHHMRDRATLLAEVDRLKALCGRVVEWRGRNGKQRPFEWSMGNGQCPVCFEMPEGEDWGAGRIGQGHAKDCWIAELREASE